MCSENDTVLSDVHINAFNVNSLCDSIEKESSRLSSYINSLPGLKVVQTRFAFKNGDKQLPSNGDEVIYDSCETTAVEPLGSRASVHEETECAAYDEDGDLIYPFTDTRKDVIIIDHSLATPLALVGLQVWRGSLLLADFFLHTGKTLLANAKVIELGAGTGFCSLVAAMFADTVVVTDHNEGVLELCERNVCQNSHLIKAEVKIQMLDWSKDIHAQNAKGAKWRWKPEDGNYLNEINMAIAADVIYRNDLTEALFRTLDQLMAKNVQVFYLALEKRLNFTIEEMDVACPAYDHLHYCLTTYGYDAKQVEINFPKYFEYDRISQLELWTIRKKT